MNDRRERTPLLAARNSLIWEGKRAIGPSGKSQRAVWNIQSARLGSSAYIIRRRYGTGDVLSTDEGIVFAAGSSTLMLPFSVHYWRNSPSRLCRPPSLGPRLSFSLYLSLVRSPSLLLWLGPLSRHTPPPFLSVPPATSPILCSPFQSSSPCEPQSLMLSAPPLPLSVDRQD